MTFPEEVVGLVIHLEQLGLEERQQKVLELEAFIMTKDKNTSSSIHLFISNLFSETSKPAVVTL